MAVLEPVDQVELRMNAVAQLLAIDMREELLAIVRKIFEHYAFAGRLAFSPEEVADLLGISRELVHDLLRTDQLGPVKAGAASDCQTPPCSVLGRRIVRQQLSARFSRIAGSAI
jgi:hypothetical protein